MDTPNIGDIVYTQSGRTGVLKCEHNGLEPYFCVDIDDGTLGNGCGFALRTVSVFLLERNSSKNHLTKLFMSNLLSRFKALTVREPSKTYQQLGIEHEDGRLTDEGMRLVVQEWHETMNKTNSAFHNKCKKLLEEKS